MDGVDGVIDRWTEYQWKIRERAVYEDEVGDNIEGKYNATDTNDSSPVVHHLPQRALDEKIEIVGGIDITPASSSHDECIVTIVVLSVDAQRVLYTYHEAHAISEPYVPSYLAMRESGPIRRAYTNFTAHTLNPMHTPAVWLIDGNGRLHEREAGLATQVGVELGIRTVGVTKNYYPMTHFHGALSHPKLFKGLAQQLLNRRGDWIGLPGASENASANTYIGAALLTGRNATNPVFVSAGHRCSLQFALSVTYALSKHRIPLPIALADKAGRQYMREHSYHC
ncbi:hypothetical protein E3P77_00159 [Wallemia ichthyophaga]|nr:hypothetical protein E3P77_00159 [Wallemia ichthyophaga]